MTRFGWMVVGIVLVVIACIIGGWYLVSTYYVQPAPALQATTTPQTDLSSSSIYTNGGYGFSLIYPAADAIAETFAPWRTGATATGTPIVSVTDAEGMLRIGASESAKEINACTKTAPAEETLADMRLGSTTFKAFMHDEVGTDNELRVTSYRVIHENACIAIESFQPLQNGQAVQSPRLSQMLQSFMFARP